jgi:hypothetical protein
MHIGDLFEQIRNINATMWSICSGLRGNARNGFGELTVNFCAYDISPRSGAGTAMMRT